MTNSSRAFTLRVWLTSIILSSVFSLLILLLKAANLHDVIEILTLLLGTPFSVLLFGVISLPSAFAFYLLCEYLLKLNMAPRLRKTFLSIIGVLLALVPIGTFGDLQMSLNFAILVSPYVFAVLASIWIYKLEPYNFDASFVRNTKLS